MYSRECVPVACAWQKSGVNGTALPDSTSSDVTLMAGRQLCGERLYRGNRRTLQVFSSFLSPESQPFNIYKHTDVCVVWAEVSAPGARKQSPKESGAPRSPLVNQDGVGGSGMGRGCRKDEGSGSKGVWRAGLPDLYSTSINFSFP